MSAKRKPCGRRVVDGYCGYERMKGKQRCVWHWLLDQPADVQASYAEKRRELGLLGRTGPRARVPEAEWPEGTRWCAGCQSFIPWVYVSGSRCKACASAAAHASRVQSTYGISGEEYDRLFKAQCGRCYICHRVPRTKRLAVDHDHQSGEVRGLLCANNENGCNRGVVANLEAAADGGLAAAKRAVLYLADPPMARLREGRRNGWEAFVRAEVARLDAAAEEPTGHDGFGAPVYTHQQEPPF